MPLFRFILEFYNVCKKVPSRKIFCINIYLRDSLDCRQLNKNFLNSTCFNLDRIINEIFVSGRALARGRLQCSSEWGKPSIMSNNINKINMKAINLSLAFQAKDADENDDY
ncbi:hypothetical protein BpHYR1_029484 [Brachionus plicatilis]|uniref:Uncharacterized protein n=1 Tax=Brachionus plicatilis TaxID=10195 RepID=A0A3M7S2R7_BRAPC|nr:hypothetical protein BpHYR1_029484 [Brachionus plicatilis]